MIAQWMIRTILTTLCVTVAAELAMRILRHSGRPTRWVWGSAIATSVLLPLVACWVQWSWPLTGLALQVNSLATRAEHVLAWSQASLPALHDLTVFGIAITPDGIVAGMLGLSVLGLSWFVGTHAWLRMTRARWTMTTLDGVAVAVSPTMGPAVCGVLHPTIVLPSWVFDEPEPTRALILEHERAHLATGDSRVLGIAAFLVALMPWNFALLWHYRQLHTAMEVDCDRRVLGCGVSVRRYSETLLRVAAHGTSVPLMSAALASSMLSIERRFLAMTSVPRQWSLVRRLAMLGGFGCAMLAVVDASSSRSVRDVFFSQLSDVVIAVRNNGMVAGAANDTSNAVIIGQLRYKGELLNVKLRNTNFVAHNVRLRDSALVIRKLTLKLAAPHN